MTVNHWVRGSSPRGAAIKGGVMTILKKGTTVYLTELGHKNFKYPSTETETLLEDTPAEKLIWVGGGDKTPFIISASAIQPSRDADKKISIWVKKIN